MSSARCIPGGALPPLRARIPPFPPPTNRNIEGWIVLPPLREAYRKPRAGIGSPACAPQEESLEAGFAEVGPACLEVVKAGTEAYRRWGYYLASQFQDRLQRRGQFWSPRGLAHMLAIDVALKNETLQFLWN